MRKLQMILSATLVVALSVLGPGSHPAVDAQSADCQMIGWTGLSFLSEPVLGWRGDIQNLDGRIVQPLVETESFGWSPDGQRLAYVATTLEGPPVLHIIDEALGAGGLEVPNLGGRIAWSPAGERLLLSDSSDGPVSVVDTAGAVVTLDAQGRNATWSSDGAWVAWTSADGVEIARPDGSEGAVLAPAPSNGALWRPGSHQLLVLAPSFVIGDADTRALTPFMVDPVNFARDFAWSPDGSTLAWSASADGTAPPRIWIESFDGAGALPISPLVASPTNPAAFEPFTGPFWSPDGTMVAMGESDGAWADGFVGGRLRVRLVPADGSSEGVVLTDFVGTGAAIEIGELLSAQWSPDRRWIAIEIRRSGLVGGGAVTGYGYSVAAVDGSSTRDLGGSFRIRGQVQWWPLLGVVAEGGACVLPAADVPSPTPTATRPQFTG